VGWNALSHVRLQNTFEDAWLLFIGCSAAASDTLRFAALGSLTENGDSGFDNSRIVRIKRDPANSVVCNDIGCPLPIGGGIYIAVIHPHDCQAKTID
jgi:hypothetical protein